MTMLLRPLLPLLMLVPMIAMIGAAHTSTPAGATQASITAQVS